jgi:hypothetical protein
LLARRKSSWQPRKRLQRGGSRGRMSALRGWHRNGPLRHPWFFSRWLFTPPGRARVRREILEKQKQAVVILPNMYDMLHEANWSREPTLAVHFDACHSFVSDLSKFKQIADSALLTLYKDKSEQGDDNPLRMFVVVSKPQPLPVERWMQIKDDPNFIRSVDPSILAYEDVCNMPIPEGTEPIDEGKPSVLVYYSYKLPMGMKNRDFLVTSTTRSDPKKGEP